MLFLAFALSAALVMSSCSTPAGAPGQPAGSQDASAPVAGGTVVTAISGDPPTVNPDVTAGVPDIFVGCMVYQGLIRIDRNFEIKPLLASSWEAAPDGLTYTFHLVKANWHDGKPFTSADVKYTLLNVSAKFGSHFTAPGAAIQTIDTPDAQTVVIHMARPFGPFLDSLDCANNTGILPQHLFEGTDVLTNPTTLSKPVGTGAFMFSEWARGDHVTLVRNPDYWQPNLPYLDRVIFKEIANPAARTLAYKAGELNEVEGYFLPTNDAAALKGDPKNTVWLQGSPVDQLSILNVRNPPYNNAAVRQALYTAVDRNFLLDHVFFGLGSTSKGAIDSRLTWAHNPAVNLDAMYPFSPTKAKTMLDSAGFPVQSNGFRFKMNLLFDSGVPNYAQTAQALSSFWRDVGVDVQLIGLDRTTELQRVFTDWNFDAVSVAYTTSGDPALGVQRAYITSSILKAPFTNGSGYSNPDVDKLFQQAQDAPTRADRAKYYNQAETILATAMPTLPLVEYSQPGVAVSQLHGLDKGVDSYSWWADAWLSH